MVDTAELERRFHDPPDFDAARSAAEAATVRWVWSRRDSDRWRAEPHWGLRNRISSGRDYAGEPTRRHGVERYGYDAAHRLRFAERFESGAPESTLIVEWEGESCLYWEFDPGGSPRMLSWSTVEPNTGRVMSTRTVSWVRSSTLHIAEEFRYDKDGRLAAVGFERTGGDYDSWVTLRRGEERITYGTDGQPTRVEVHYDHPDAEPEIIYESVEEGWEELARAIHAPLVEAIAAAVVHAADDEIALMALYYPSADIAVPPPLVSLCPTKRRDELTRERGFSRVILLPGEWRQDELAVDLPDTTAEYCRKMGMLVDQGRAPNGAPHELTLSVARSLAGYTWPSSFPRSGDFAVYAVDADGEDLERNVEASVPDQRVAEWRARGMLDPLP